MGHSLGPWHVDFYGTLRDDDDRLVMLDEGSPNSRLIVAAPEMYELLRKLSCYGQDDELLSATQALLARIDGE